MHTTCYLIGFIDFYYLHLALNKQHKRKTFSTLFSLDVLYKVYGAIIAALLMIKSSKTLVFTPHFHNPFYTPYTIGVNFMGPKYHYVNGQISKTGLLVQ
jgi:hypothetical protein